MGDLKPEENPNVVEAESLVHDAYMLRHKLEVDYEDQRTNACICAYLGAVSLTAGHMFRMLPETPVNIIVEGVGYFYQGIGAAALAIVPFTGVKAFVKSRQLKALR